jgi:hypothetical protein
MPVELAVLERARRGLGTQYAVSKTDDHEATLSSAIGVSDVDRDPVAMVAQWLVFLNI